MPVSMTMRPTSTEVRSGASRRPTGSASRMAGSRKRGMEPIQLGSSAGRERPEADNEGSDVDQDEQCGAEDQFGIDERTATPLDVGQALSRHEPTRVKR